MILDTHIHLFEVTRPEGVPWPPPENRTLFRNWLPADYEAEARPLGVLGAGVVEASPLHADNRWVLDRTAGNLFFPFTVAQLPIGAPNFPQLLDELAQEARVVGVRGFLWGPALTLDDVQLDHLRQLAARGMTLDIISRGTLNPKDRVDALARAVPDLRIIVDHFAGAKGTTPDPAWLAGVRQLATNLNVHLKLSAFFDMFNPTDDEIHPWVPPTELDAYRPHLDAAFEAFGPDRLLFGSNWPVCNLGGTLATTIALAEAYLAGPGAAVRDKVMYKNATELYRRVAR